MGSENCIDKKHFVLVHGACHGAWCWYKLKPRLESAGHKVTVLDLAASGANMKKIEDVDTFSQYTEPLLFLLDTIPSNEKVVLVGHSFGGLNIALAMEKFPEKVAVGVFLTAFAPDVEHHPSYVLEKYSERTPLAAWLDTEFAPSGNKTTMFFGPNFLSDKLYQLSPIEDLKLAKTLARPASLFIEDLSKQKNFSKEGYGSVPRAYIVCTEDLTIPLEYQLWMIQNAGFNDVLEIKGSVRSYGYALQATRTIRFPPADRNCIDKKHYVLVHGACHGAWSWYKLKPRLESAGHKVTSLDLAASGINMKKIDDVHTFSQYSDPLLRLMATIPKNEKVVLVGHSLGGLNIALAMDKFPKKVTVGVFLAAFAPDTEHQPSYVLEKYNERTPSSAWLDTEFAPSGNKTSMFFGPNFLSNKLYQLSPIEDLELAKTLVRPSSLFVEDLSTQKNFSKEGYGSVPRRKHYVLVHGACHGAWCWYKLKPRLESEGHKVTVLNHAASGINMKKIEDVDTFSEYTEPLLQLLDTIPSNEKVVLVGHSLGGMSIAIAMEKFPEKVAVGVFLAAFAPDVEHRPSYVLEKYNERTPSEEWLDTEFCQCGNKTLIFFGPKFLSYKLYQLCPIEVAVGVFLAAFAPDTEHQPSYVLEKYIERIPPSEWFDTEFAPSGNKTSILLGPEILAKKLYQLSPIEHYVLVHGACHGAWCWYKLKPRLESEGHKVTVLNHAASGINMKKIEDVGTFSEYTEPLLQLLDTIPSNEKVVLVGHSLGGMSIAIAMEKFQEKVAVGVFLAAFAPDVEHRPSYVLEKYNERTPSEEWLDTEFCQCGNKTLMFFGPKFLSYKLYQLCPGPLRCDLELAMTLARPSSFFIEHLSKEKNFSKQRYGSVPRVYTVCPEDLGIPLNYQHWMIQNAGFNDVVEINGADHKPMVCKPQELCDSLQQIAAKYQ
ncbi:Salicylic acid-binding protein 2 [Glycine max]|nr:Salicylic acid-binding protein 2 [Glycine max]